MSEQATDDFDHEVFVPLQVEHLAVLWKRAAQKRLRALDVGGGTGRFAQALMKSLPQVEVTVLDVSGKAVAKAQGGGTRAILGSILAPPPTLEQQRFDVVTFNMVLHHLVGDNERETQVNQVSALSAGRRLLAPGGRVFLNEYCYYGYIADDLSGKLIFALTRSRALAPILRRVGSLRGDLRANTAGVGVRFRPSASWRALATAAGLAMEGDLLGPPEPPSLARRLAVLVRHVHQYSAVFSGPQ